MAFPCPPFEGLEKVLVDIYISGFISSIAECRWLV